MAINYPACGNCKYFYDTRKTAKGKTEYFGKCKMGYPIKQGEVFVREGYKYRYSGMKIRTDKACRKYEEEA